MITLTTLIIAGIATLALLIACFAKPHPIFWIMTLLLIGLQAMVLYPKYFGQQQALAQGVSIEAAVDKVRTWKRKNSQDIQDYYEIIALAPNPSNGQIHTFISPPMKNDPQPYLGKTVRVTVDWSNPQAYVMDLSFLPHPPQ